MLKKCLLFLQLETLMPNNVQKMVKKYLAVKLPSKSIKVSKKGPHAMHTCSPVVILQIVNARFYDNV